MKTVAEILRETGLDDAAIAALDAKVTGAFTQVLSTATETLEQAELAKRANAKLYDEEIAPALNAWGNEKTQKDAEIAFYQKQLEGAKAAGFLPASVPGAPANPVVRDPAGKFVAGQPGATPGSPTYMTREEGFSAVTTAQWFISEYMRLNNGAPPPDDMSVIAAEANSQKMPFKDYAAKKYGFQEKRDAIKAAEQKKHDDAIVQATTDKLTKEFTEKYGNNPNVRQAESSKFSVLEKAVKDGQRKDPLMMTPEERRNSTRQQVQREITENSTVQ